MRLAQQVYRAPYLYFCQTSESNRIVRIGTTTRPAYEQQRLQQRYASALLWLLHVRAYAVLAPILWQRFEYCAVGRQWFNPDRRLLHLVEQLGLAHPERLITVNKLQGIFVSVFPESPFVGVAQYRLSETYIRSTRKSTY